MKENTNNPGTFGTATVMFASTDVCSAVQECADSTDAFFDGSFDLHFRLSTNKWECVQYGGPNRNGGAYFNVVDTDIREVYGYTM